MLKTINNIKPIANSNAEFNNKEELGKKYREPNIFYDYDYYKMTVKPEKPLSNFTLNMDIRNISKDYANANNILQLGYSYSSTLSILSSVDKKNKGNIKLTCIDSYFVDIKEKTEIDKHYAYQFVMIYGSILWLSKYLKNSTYNIIYVTIKLRDEDLYTLLLNFVKYYDVHIILTELVNLSVIKFMVDTYNVVISEIKESKEVFVVDMKFVEHEVEKYSSFGVYDNMSTVYFVE